MMALNPYGRLRVGIGCAPGLTNAERFEPTEAGNDRNRRPNRQFDVVACRKGIDEEAELEGRLDESLHAHAGRALAAVAEPHGDRVAIAQKAAHDPDHQGLVPRRDIEPRVVEHVEHRAVRRFDGGVVRRLWIAPLGPPMSLAKRCTIFIDPVSSMPK
jgi:hypothetical protein